jgi:hypothetical protein
VINPGKFINCLAISNNDETAHTPSHFDHNNTFKISNLGINQPEKGYHSHMNSVIQNNIPEMQEELIHSGGVTIEEHHKVVKNTHH